MSDMTTKRTTSWRAFLNGVSSIFNIMPRIGNGNYDYEEDGFARDAANLAGDWRKVGNDIAAAMKPYRNK